MAILTSTDKCFKIDGVLMSFNSRDVTPLANGVRFTNRSTGQSIDVPVTGTTLNGTPATTVQSILDFVEEYFFNVGGGSGDGAVESVTGDLVSGTAENPIINLPSDVIKTADTSNTSVADKVVRYSNIGAVNTAMPQFPENAVPLFLLDVRIPSAPASGTYILKSVDGVVSWVAE